MLHSQQAPDHMTWACKDVTFYDVSWRLSMETFKSQNQNFKVNSKVNGMPVHLKGVTCKYKQPADEL